MAYTIPTVADLKLQFPAFADVPDATVQAYIDRAARTVTEAWSENDYADGILLLACHLMVLSGLGKGAAAESYANGMAGYSTVRSGQLTLQRAASSQETEGVPSPWNATGYGVQFYWLAKRNIPTVAIASALLACGDGLYPPLGSPARYYPWGY